MHHVGLSAKSNFISHKKVTEELSELHEELLFMRNTGLELIDNCLCPRQW